LVGGIVWVVRGCAELADKEKFLKLLDNLQVGGHASVRIVWGECGGSCQ